MASLKLCTLTKEPTKGSGLLREFMMGRGCLVSGTVRLGLFLSRGDWSSGGTCTKKITFASVDARSSRASRNFSEAASFDRNRQFHILKGKRKTNQMKKEGKKSVYLRKSTARPCSLPCGSSRSCTEPARYPLPRLV